MRPVPEFCLGVMVDLGMNEGRMQIPIYLDSGQTPCEITGEGYPCEGRVSVGLLANISSSALW